MDARDVMPAMPHPLFGQMSVEVPHRSDLGKARAKPLTADQKENIVALHESGHSVAWIIEHWKAHHGVTLRPSSVYYWIQKAKGKPEDPFAPRGRPTMAMPEKILELLSEECKRTGATPTQQDFISALERCAKDKYLKTHATEAGPSCYNKVLNRTTIYRYRKLCGMPIKTKPARPKRIAHVDEVLMVSSCCG